MSAVTSIVVEIVRSRPDQAKGGGGRSARVDGTVVKAWARAHRWQGMPESGAFATVVELAAAERINPSYLAPVLRLALLAPDIVESIVDGRQDPERVTLDRLMKPFPVEWGEQLQGF